MIKSAGIAVVVVVALAIFGFSALLPSASSESGRFDEKVNLALRRTGHYLLKATGDTTSQIPAVKKIDQRTFVLQLNRPFLYDSLPALLQSSLALHQLTQSYDVAVLNCQTGELELGYASFDYFQNQEVPCGGRHQNLNCYQVKVTFAMSPTPSSAPSRAMGWVAVAVIGILAAIFGVLRLRPSQAPAVNTDTPAAASQISVGQSALELSNLALHVGTATHTLTYREAKLLQLFAHHPNQVLERDFILQSVWGDEGVTVGRSIDVFVSRLRKLLQADHTLKIVAVHGVGYRLEVRQEAEGASD